MMAAYSSSSLIDKGQSESPNPLGVLLGLLEKKNLVISDFSLAQIADEYWSYLEGFKNRDVILENISEFLWVASKLALLKSKILISNFDFEEEEEEKGDLKERLIEYEKFKNLSKTIKNQFQKNEEFFSRFGTKMTEENFSFNLNENDFKEIFARLIRNFKEENKNIYKKKTIKEIIKIEERIKQIRKILSRAGQFKFSETIFNKTDKTEIVVSFLSVLELAKQGSIEIKQSKCFGGIKIVKKVS